MTVHTQLNKELLSDFLAHYDLDGLLDYHLLFSKPAAHFYYLDTVRGPFVLNIFEQLSENNLVFYTDLIQLYSRSGIPSECAIADVTGRFFHTLAGSKAMLCEYLPGNRITLANQQQCVAVGDLLGHIHVIGQDIDPKRVASPANSWDSSAIETLLDVLPVSDALLLQEELGCHKIEQFDALPNGIIHGNVTKNTVLFTQNTVTGIIDFEHACYDKLLYDLAIAVNAFCLDEQGLFIEDNIVAMVDAYEQQRALTPLEIQHWPLVRRALALKQWLSSLLSDNAAHANGYKKILQQLSFIPN